VPWLIAGALRSRPGRFWLTAGGIAICTVLVLALQAAHESVEASVRAYLGQPGMDLWIAPAGVDNFMRSSALLPTALADSLRTVPGVAAADPVARGSITVKSGRGRTPTVRRLALIGVGYAAPDGLGGPPVLLAGRAPSRRNDIALDRAAAWRLGVALGDTTWVGGRAAVVTGLSGGSNLLATQLAFANLGAIAGLSGIRGQASFVVIRLGRGQEPAGIAQTIADRYPDYAVYGREEFLAANLREIGAGFMPLLSLIGLLGVAAAAFLIALLSHALVEQSRDEIAVLLALGAPTRGLAGVLVGEALILVTLGFLLGLGAAAALGEAMDRWWPVIPFPVDVIGAVDTLALFAAAGAAAVLLPLLQLRRIDPLEAFRP
jgi:putative ABC transport system permease protein